jgi:hypothetical protein
MVSKKILGVAIAAAFSSQAFAVIDLTAGTGAVGTGAVTYAKETILTSQVTSSWVQVAAATTELNIQVAAGFGVVATNHAYVRFNLVNAKFKTGVTGASLTGLTVNSIAPSGASVSQGGAAGDDYVIFDITAGSAGLGQADKLQLALTDLQVSPSASATVYYTLFNLANASQAVAATGSSTAGSLANDNYAFASVAEVLTTTFAATDRVADVSALTPFTLFVSPASATASLGSVKLDITAGALTAAGVAVTGLAQVIDIGAAKSKLEVTGDLSYTVGASAAATAANLTFGGVASNTAATNVASAKLDNLSTFTAGATNSVAVTAVSAINAGAYSLTFTPTAIASAQYTPSAKTGALGTITRSGTTIQVPYVTTFADYNQRLVLVNRSALSAPYKVTFTPESGVTAAAGAMATGTLAPMQTKIIKATDVVTLTGGTRTAATVTVTAPSSTIDAATTSVNLADKSTDTVKLQ